MLRSWSVLRHCSRSPPENRPHRRDIPLTARMRSRTISRSTSSDIVISTSTTVAFVVAACSDPACSSKLCLWQSGLAAAIGTKQKPENNPCRSALRAALVFPQFLHSCQTVPEIQSLPVCPQIKHILRLIGNPLLSAL